MAEKPLLSIDELRQLLDYNPENGELRWKKREAHWFPTLAHATSWNKRNAGNLTFTQKSKNGYLFGSIYGRTYMAHRIIWAMNKGENVKAGHFIDHIDGNPANNLIENLREVLPVQNQYNSQKKGNAARGACYHKANKKWTSSIRIHLGYFDSEQEAADAYEAAAKILHSKFYLKDGVRKRSDTVRKLKR